MDVFPPEVALLILSQVPQRTLVALCSLSKALRGVAEAALYRSASVGAEGLKGWCSAIIGSEKGKEARVLTIALPNGQIPASNAARLQSALERCGNLRQLHVLQAGDYLITVKDDPQLWPLLTALSCRLTHFTVVAPFTSHNIAVAAVRFFATQNLTAISLPNCSVKHPPDLSCLPSVVSLSITAKAFEAVQPAVKGWKLQNVQLYMTFNDVQRLRFLAQHVATLTSLSLVRDPGSAVPTADMMTAIAKWVPGIERLCITETGTSQPRRDEPSLHHIMSRFPSLRKLVLQFHRTQITFFEDPDPPARAEPTRRSARNAPAPAPPPAPLKLTRPGDRRKLGDALMAAFPQLDRLELGADVFVGAVGLEKTWVTAVWARFPSGAGPGRVEWSEVAGRVWDAQTSFSGY
ncbi:hypothetical protein MIND_00630300 [Mycena indigotica]|uniref:F-box domain-containing protein n=1 Tax=Mycena indigotica TaxID=2126181 RepID=A0A8H6W5X2_9AGAR|nr:uncharacterized protein MIND_00630300 [Mycena indigotica]KAF7303991.1 hypothetical protein MIND_00630300 [Mycena indigotica]